MNRKIVYFLGPSIIISKNDYIYCENGWYDTNKEISQFSKNAVLVTPEQKFRGDSLIYDRIKQTSRAIRNVSIIDTSQKSVIYGDYAEYQQKSNEVWVKGRATYSRLIDQDTLFLGAETLYHKDLDSNENLVLAYYHVRIYHKQIQAKSDSASFNTRDSLMQLFYSPILWTNFSQGTSKNMMATIGKKSISGFTLDGQALLLQQVDSLKADKYNQLLGKNIYGVLSNDSLRKVTVKGNVEILYFPKNKNKYMGLNNTSCNEAVLWFKNGNVDRVALKPKTGGELKPLKDADIPNARLKGFNWQYNNRPTSREELHLK